MKLSSKDSIFNMGDTSFRRNTLLEDYKELLPLLMEHNNQYPVWERNNHSQEVFFSTVLEKTMFYSEDAIFEDYAKRGRTLTNALIKPGLINDKRELGEVSINWINGETKQLDRIENLMTLSLDNIIFIRQLFKLRVYDPNGYQYFYPFRVALEILRKYNDVQELHLLSILHLISTELNDDKIHKIIKDYEKVIINEVSWDDFVEQSFMQNNEDIKGKLIEVKQLFELSKIDKDKFFEIFKNRKTRQEVYYTFFKVIKKFQKQKTLDSLKDLIGISKHPAIKKAFGFNKIPFEIPKSINLTVEEFLRLNNGNKLLNGNYKDFYLQFIKSKKADLIAEYSDMTKRIFSLTGFINFNSGLVNLNQPWIIESLFKVADDTILLSGNECISNYEGNIESPFYSDISLTEILQLSTNQVLQIENTIQQKFGVTNISMLQTKLEIEEENRFRKVIQNEFSRERVIELLDLFSNRSVGNDRQIQKLVTDSATIPTIFEYVLAIAWFYVSDQEYSLRKSVNLSLDGNYKPLTHAIGGDGDIVMDFPQYKLMLEATLMNPNAQKRAELEPVIRHAVNLTIRSCKKVLTIFVADKVDTNVTNIFRSVSYVELNSTEHNYRDKSIDGVDIFALNIKEISKIIQSDIKQTHIINKITENYTNDLARVKNGWREKIVKEILA